MKVVEFADAAKADVARIDAWWRWNRRAAPGLFASELERVILALVDNPALGLHYEPRPGVRRMLLRRTRYHLYLHGGERARTRRGGLERLPRARAEPLGLIECLPQRRFPTSGIAKEGL